LARTSAIIVAGGRGERFGGAKQFTVAGGARLVDHAVATAGSVCDEVVIVLPEGYAWDVRGVAAAVVGGDTRSESVRSGLTAIDPDTDIVVVHDGARPLASVGLFELVIETVRAGADAAIPVLEVADTLKRVDAGTVIETLDRESVVMVQTPQAFRADALRAAHADAAEATDDAALVEQRGGKVVVVAGDPRNIKVTTVADLALVTTLLEAT
jgi:2-C-methyl-D-erythritol 4-phosphate cytidylyltransferase